MKNSVQYTPKTKKGMIKMLSSKQRSNLRSKANRMETILQVGKDGINENLVTQVDDALTARELIKMRVLENAPVSAREACYELAERTNGEGVQIIGTRFVLYRRNKDKGQYDDCLK